MSDLVVLDFDGVGTADEVLTKLRGMQKEYLIDLEDACIVVHTEAGKVQVKQAVNLTSIGAASGASTGMLIGALAGLLVLNPLAGMAVGGLAGAGFGALSGSMSDYGINDEFIKSVGEMKAAVQANQNDKAQEVYKTLKTQEDKGHEKYTE